MMKRKENFRIGRKNLTVVVLAFVLVISAMLTACGSSAIETTPEAKEEVAVDKVEEKTAEEAAQAETVEEEVVESTEEVETFKSAGAWAQSIDRAEPKMTIWNEITKEGIIIENEQKYSLKEGDQLVICTKEKNSGLSIHSDLSLSEFKSRSSTSYTQFIFNKVFLEETLFEVVMTVAGTEYTFSVTFVPEGTKNTVLESETKDMLETTELSGEDWVSTLEYDEPKLVVWNDETGTKEVIELGGKYVMQQGDILGMYCPIGYSLFNVFPIDVATGTIVVSNVEVIEFNLPSESQDINLEAEILNPQDEFVTYSYVITTP